MLAVSFKIGSDAVQKNQLDIAYVFLPLFSLTTAGCASDIPQSPIQLGPGWNCLATPTAFDGAGYVFRVTSERIPYTVSDYSAIANIQDGPAPAIIASKSYKASAGIIADILKLPLTANATASQVYNVTQTLSNARMTNVDDDGATAVRAKFYERSDLNPKDNYYFVRRSITSTSISYSFDQDIAANVDVSTPVSIANLKPKASYKSENGFRYDTDFGVPVNVCILAAKFSSSKATRQCSRWNSKSKPQ